MAFRMNVALRDDLRAWIDFSAGLNGGSATAYINAAIQRDKDAASNEVMEAFAAFLKAREAEGIDGERPHAPTKAPDT